jgi:hypothetical protein
MRCGTDRFDGIDAYGGVGSRAYSYPEGYSYAKDETPSRAELRIIMLGPVGERRRHLEAVSDVSSSDAPITDAPIADASGDA